MARIVLQYIGCIAEMRDELYCKRLAGEKFVSQYNGLYCD